MLLIKGGQHWGQHFVKYAARKEPMPVACVIGWDPIMPFLAGSPIPTGVCEWDVMGGYRGEPAELVKCETVDLEVPATAEIVLEGFISDDPSTYELEGPFGEFTGYVSDIPTLAADHEGHVHHPPERSDLPRLPGGHAARLLQREQRDVVGPARGHRLEHPDPGRHSRRARGLRAAHHQRGQRGHPDHASTTRASPSRSPPRSGATAPPSTATSTSTVVEDDIDPSSYEQVDWAFAHRVNAGQDGIVIFPGIFGSPIDPEHPAAGSRGRPARHGALESRAHRRHPQLEVAQRPEWDGERFPPTVRPAPEDEARVRDRWNEYGLGDL